MPWAHSNRLWVGRHETHGAIVFDKSQDREGSATVTVYYVLEDRFATVKREVMRKYTSGRGLTDAEVTEAISNYLSYEERKLQKKHADFLEQVGKAPAQLRLRSNRLPSRITHCYVCHEPLDSTVDYECSACGWIICRCGACGCGHE